LKKACINCLEFGIIKSVALSETNNSIKNLLKSFEKLLTLKEISDRVIKVSERRNKTNSLESKKQVFFEN